MNTFRIYEQAATHFGDEAGRFIANLLSDFHDELKNSVTKEDFSQLKGVVSELAVAQERTGQRLDSLTVKVEELAEAQKQTDVSIKELTEAQKRTEKRVEELAVAQERTEKRLDSLTVKVEELAEAQDRTDMSIKELTESQKRTDVSIKELMESQKQTDLSIKALTEAQMRTEKKVEALTEAQHRTEGRVDKLSEALTKLTENVSDLRSTVGGMQRTMSYALENEAYRKIPALVKDRFGFITEEKIIRKYVGDVEINLIAKGHLNGEPCLLVGESKDRIQPKQIESLIDELDGHVQLAQEAYGIKNVLRLLVTHSAHDRAVEALKREGIEIIQSFEWN